MLWVLCLSFGLVIQPSLGSIGFPLLHPNTMKTKVASPKIIPCGGNSSSCLGRCDVIDGHLPCACDDNCQMYQDCCKDYLDVCGDTRYNITDVISPNTECIIAFDRPEKLINRCPLSYANTSVISQCHVITDQAHVLDTIPVTDVSTGLNYRNMYCALCNGVTDAVGWDMRVLCPSTHPISPGLYDLLDKIRSGACKMTPQRPQVAQKRQCLTDVIGECSNPNDTDIVQRCQESSSYIQPASHTPNIYRNVYCFMCREEEDSPENCIEIQEAPEFETYPFMTDYDMGVLVWNTSYRTWGLTLLPLGYTPVSTDLFVCHVGDSITSRCPSDDVTPRMSKGMVPFSLNVLVSLRPVVPMELPIGLHHDDLRLVTEVNLRGVLDECFQNHSWEMVGGFVLKNIAMSETFVSFITFFNLVTELDSSGVKYLRELVLDLFREATKDKCPDTIIHVNFAYGAHHRSSITNNSVNVQISDTEDCPEPLSQSSVMSATLDVLAYAIMVAVLSQS